MALVEVWFGGDGDDEEVIGVVSARGSNTGLSLLGPTKIKACKSFLFTEGSLRVEDEEHLVNFVVTQKTFK